MSSSAPTAPGTPPDCPLRTVITSTAEHGWNRVPTNARTAPATFATNVVRELPHQPRCIFEFIRPAPFHHACLEVAPPRNNPRPQPHSFRRATCLTGPLRTH